MHPNGQMPAYEWAFGDVNPPVHAWAAMRVYQIEEKIVRPHRPRFSRAHVPQAAAQLHVVGEPQGRRGQQHLRGRLPGPRQHQRVRPHVRACPAAGISSRRTARAGWRMYCLNLLGIALELAKEDPVYEDVATKFFEHFVYIGAAVNRMGGRAGCGTTRTATTTTCCEAAGWTLLPDRGAHDRRLDPHLRRRGRRSRGDRGVSAISRSGCAGSPRTSPSCCAGWAT